MARNEIGTNYAEELQHTRGALDSGLYAMWLAAKKENGRIQDWWKIYAPIAGLVVDSAVWTALMGATGQWSDHEDLLLAAIDDSSMGKKVFTPYLAKVLESKISKTIREMTKPLVEQDLNDEVLSRTRKQIRDRIATYATSDQLPGRRQVTVPYRGHELSMRVESVEQEINYHLYALVKGRAVEQGQLDPLYCESSLCSSQPVCGSASVCAKLLEGPAMARNLAKEALPDDSVASSDMIRTVLQKRQSNLASIDETFGLEVQFFTSMGAEAGAAALRDMIMNCLPSHGVESTAAAAALNEINVVLSSSLAKFCDKQTQGVGKACKEMVASVSMGRRPSVPTRTASEILKGFMGKLPNLFSYQHGQQKLYGKEALDAVYDLVELEGAKNLEDIEPLVIYGWCFSPEKQAKISAWSKSVAGGAKLAASAAQRGASSSAGKSSSSSAAASRSKKDVARKATMDLFS